MSNRRLVSILFLVGFLTYFFSFGNQFVWDDEQFIQKNLFLTSSKYLGQIFTTNTIAGAGHASNYYRPLTTLGFWIDYHLWGLNPFGFHLSNTLLHVGAGIGLFWLLLKLKFGRLASFWVSLFFLVHPIQTEAVVYMNSRGDSQYAFCLVVSWWFFVKGLAGERWRGFGRGWWLGLSYLFYLASLLSKEIALSMIGFYPILIATWMLVNKQSWRGWWSKYSAAWLSWGGMILTVGGYMWLRLTVLNFGNTLNFVGYQTEYTQNLSIRLFTFAKIIWIYLGLLLWPYPLHMERTSQIIQSWNSPWVFMSLVLLVILIVGAIWRWRQGSPWWLFGLALSGLGLVPVSGIVPINGLLYEHWLYLPMVGLLIILFDLARSLPINWSKRETTLGWCGGVLASIYVILTLYQNSLWSEPIKFYEYTLQYSDAARLHNNLAMAYSENNQSLPQAVEQYQAAIRLDDSYPQTHHNLGNAYIALGKYPEAEAEYLRALQLDPNFSFTYPQLIRLYLVTKQPAKALPYVQKIYPGNENDLQTNLVYGKVLWDMGQKSEAEQKFNLALQLSNQDPQVLQEISQLKRPLSP